MIQQRARIISQEKGLYRISCGGWENRAELSGKFIYETNTAADYPAVGDYVIATCPTDGSRSVITDLFPRKSAFVRRAAGSRNTRQVVARNIDTVFLCMSLNNNFNLRRMERYLSIAWDCGAVPVIVLTKADLCRDIGEKTARVESIAPGVDILTVSSYNDDIEAVKKYLTPGQTVAFLGSSGVGKSTLINKIVGNDAIKTAEIRPDGKGRHTTTHRELISLDNGAFVIDTPGMRELGLWDSAEGIDRRFSDIERLTQKCRFADCTHTNEPGCAVLAAVASGILDEDRWLSYQKLKSENRYVQNQIEYMQAKKEKFKQIAKKNKFNKKDRVKP